MQGRSLSTFTFSLFTFNYVMYYYIFDIKKCKKRSQVQEIKDYLGGLGISGEFTFPTAAQNADELVSLGLSKQYSTIVAVGSEEIANVVAGRLLGRKEAFGVIPLEASSEICQLIGTSNWREACENLRYRKISEVRLGQTATGYSFLTKISLQINTAANITLEFRDFIVQTKATNLVISIFDPGIKKIGDDYLDISVSSANPNEFQIINKLASFFGTKQPQEKILNSIFRGRSLRIFTKTPTPLLCESTVVAKTPQLIESTDEKIRLITSKNSLL